MIGLGRENPVATALCDRHSHSLTFAVGEALAYVQGASLKAGANP